MTLPPYPESRVEHVVEQLHGVEVRDPYRWLEDASADEVREWTARQNAYTRTTLDALPGRAALAARLDGLLEVGSIGTPAPVKGRYFHTRREGKQNQPVLYVREGLHGADRPLVDANQLAADGTIALDWWYPSRDGRLLAFGLSRDGNEKSTLYVRDVDTGLDLPDTIDRTRACAVAWLPDASGFYYTRYPAPGSVPAGEEDYHRAVWFHRLGDDPARDVKVFGDGRPKEDWPDARLSPDGRWLLVHVHQGWSRNEVYFLDRHSTQPAFVPLAVGVEALYHVVARPERFWVHTNDGAPRYRLFEVDPRRPGREHWVERIPEGDDVLEAVAVVGDVLVADYMHRATSRLRLFDRTGRPLSEVPLPGLGTVAGLGAEWDGKELLFGFQSFTVPPSIYRVDLSGYSSTPPPGLLPEAERGSQHSPLPRGETGEDGSPPFPEREGGSGGLGPASVHPGLWDRVKVDIALDDYALEQVVYSSRDGTPVTMFLAYRKGVERDGNNPTVLYGYGGFNISLTPSFSASRFAFLERGGVLAVANLRGGGEHGEAWHRGGMLADKQNTFDDFLAAADRLISQRYTSPERLAIMGGSNGGLLVGAALTQRPDLFRAVVCQVPLLDMLRYHRFLIARLWIPEYGSPDEPEPFGWLHAYSPYHRVNDGEHYPAVLLATAESDTRVDALHARKMAARLQAASASGRPVLLRLEPKAGHGAGKPRAKVVEELADTWSFVFWQLEMLP